MGFLWFRLLLPHSPSGGYWAGVQTGAPALCMGHPPCLLRSFCSSVGCSGMKSQSSRGRGTRLNVTVHVPPRVGLFLPLPNQDTPGFNPQGVWEGRSGRWARRNSVRGAPWAPGSAQLPQLPATLFSATDWSHWGFVTWACVGHLSVHVLPTHTDISVKEVTKNTQVVARGVRRVLAVRSMLRPATWCCAGSHGCWRLGGRRARAPGLPASPLPWSSVTSGGPLFIGFNSGVESQQTNKRQKTKHLNGSTLGKI